MANGKQVRIFMNKVVDEGPNQTYDLDAICVCYLYVYDISNSHIRSGMWPMRDVAGENTAHLATRQRTVYIS